jgi:hypothetical protein
MKLVFNPFVTPDTVLTFFRMDFSKIPVLKERSHLVQFLRSAHDAAGQNPLHAPWTNEMYGAVLDKLLQLHKAEFTTLVQDFGKENVRVLENWYSSQSKEVFSTLQHSAMRRLIITGALESDEWSALRPFLSSLTDQDIQELTQTIKKSVKGKEFYFLQTPLEILRKVGGDYASRRRMWTDLLVSNTVQEGGLDEIEFHTLFLHIRELESPEMVSDIIQKVLSSKKISGRVTQSLESYLLETWDEQGRAWVEGAKATSSSLHSQSVVVSELETPRSAQKVPSLPRPHL